MKIKKIKKIEYDSDVYNLHIEDNHNYFANNICVSNCHGLVGSVVRSVSEAAINADIRIGCTGSLPDHKCDQYQIINSIGHVIDVVTSRQLIDMGHATDIKIKIFHLNYPETVIKELRGCSYDMEKAYLETYVPRNNVIKFIANKHMEKDHNMLILVNKLDHASEIYNIMQTLKSKEHVFLVTGEVDVIEREHIRKFTNENKRVIIVATSGVFSTGISIKRLHAVVFAAAGKSKIRTIQSIGRGLRLHKEKNMFLLYDISDSLKYSERHLEKRIGFYEKAEFNMDIKEIQL
jgi:superfamily II DNA or RNA helicase